MAWIAHSIKYVVCCLCGLFTKYREVYCIGESIGKYLYVKGEGNDKTSTGVLADYIAGVGRAVALHFMQIKQRYQ